MSDGLEGSGVLKLPLDLLERDDLRRGRRGDAEHLAQEGGLPYDRERENVAADGGLEDGIAHVRRPAWDVAAQFKGSRIGAHFHEQQRGFLGCDGEDLSQRRGGSMGERDPLEASGKALARARGEPESRGAGGDYVNRTFAATKAVPLPFEASGPARQEMRLVEEEDRPSLLGGGLVGAKPEALPETGHHGLGTVHSRVDRGISVALGKLEKQGGLANLPRPGEKLDPTRWGLGQPAGQKLSALGEADPVLLCRHSRIIIRLY